MQNEILDLTRKLISFKTVNGNDKEFTECFGFIKNFFAKEIKSGKIIVKEYKKNNLPSIVFLNIDTLKPDIILAGHIDVVGADDKDFIPKIKNGKLFGRGTADMKSEVAVLMIAFREIIKSGTKKSIALMLTADEEMTGKSGAGYLINEIGYRSKAAIAPDGGHNFELVVKEKGGFWIKIAAKGKLSHGSRPWLGENAILKLIKFYQYLEKEFPPLKKTKLMYQNGVSLNLGKISGGKTINSVPDSAEMYLDLRYSDKKDRKGIIDVIKKLSRRHNMDFQITDIVEMLETDVNNDYIKKFQKVAAKIINRPIKIEKVTGGSDARFFSAKNIPVIIMVPNCGNKHGANEWVQIKSLEKFYRIIKEFLAQI